MGDISLQGSCPASHTDTALQCSPRLTSILPCAAAPARVSLLLPSLTAGTQKASQRHAGVCARTLATKLCAQYIKPVKSPSPWRRPLSLSPHSCPRKSDSLRTSLSTENFIHLQFREARTDSENGMQRVEDSENLRQPRQVLPGPGVPGCAT